MADVADKAGHESVPAADSPWGWIITVAIFICGLGFVFVRRRFGAFPIGKPEPFPGAFDFAPESDA
jgi:hypothetical protein